MIQADDTKWMIYKRTIYKRTIRVDDIQADERCHTATKVLLVDDNSIRYDDGPVEDRHDGVDPRSPPMIFRITMESLIIGICIR